MLRILHDTKYDFIGAWKTAAALTAAWILIGLVAGGIRGIHWGTEFRGGTMIEVHFAKDQTAGDVRSAVDAAGYQGAEIQQFGPATDYTIRAKPRNDAEANAGEQTTREIEAALRQKFGATGVTIARSEFVGPRVGAELRRNATIALLISFVVTMVYLAIRFEWRFGLAAILSSMHDVFATIAFIAIMRLEVSLTVVAAILTVLGYSMNDTIIIFDRVRENLKKQRKESFREVLNRSINETLPRSVLTHATTAAATLSLLLFGGEVIKPFSWVMLFGIVMGTFSSIYVAGILLLWIETKWPKDSGDKGTARALAAERQVKPRPGQTVAAR